MRSEKSPAARVIVADDEPLIRWSISEALGREGYHVDDAHNGARMLECLEKESEHEGLVLLDLKLPDCSDLSLLKIVRKRAPHWRVVLMTAHGTPELAEEALQLGATHVLHKPFDIHDIVRIVESALKRPSA
ncbi:MAG: response regulator [Vicinamibacterales bacterium]|jgi:DNA-binding NtrC family response regulator|nr:two-component system response regulator [Acidobacteriota bacterium]MDP6371076.1 response regulator [Vicinamibacterales bacterium]MDP6610572.1 response regulator [Vicinamibacterales bacterium]HAK55432.1 two-component system response regulator [Acidobacteriota bacterium]|tara:strand:+ start:5882 stop:6277 length:396 start_codon:yes stop_codon:yes gene_type:complete